jgi:hypothetical protein
MQKWHRWHVVGTIGRSLARFFFPDAIKGKDTNEDTDKDKDNNITFI